MLCLYVYLDQILQAEFEQVSFILHSYLTFWFSSSDNTFYDTHNLILRPGLALNELVNSTVNSIYTKFSILYILFLIYN